MELDADVYAGIFVASTLRLGVLGEIEAEDLPHWCELLAFVASVTFNTFEVHARREDYKNGYHLPSTRTECFLEGAARGLDIQDPAWFAAGADAGFKFCAKHYQAPATLATIEADIADLELHTQPLLRELRHAFSEHVPEAWRK
jgi:hypothetical protein